MTNKVVIELIDKEEDVYEVRVGIITNCLYASKDDLRKIKREIETILKED